jgi:GNAT superfamily N-acetyltransferase
VDPGHRPGTTPDGYAALTGPRLGRFLAFDAELDAPHLTGHKHDHLAILAVRPGRQGQGTGTALLHARHATLDREGTAAYLEASSQRTRRIYLRHGYTDHGSPIELPGGPLMYPMTRQPRPGQRRGDG